MEMNFIILIVFLGLSDAQFVSLESYNIDRSEISVSGFSAGGAMAAQFHVAYSSVIKGHAQFAGASPPFCALTGFPNCANDPYNIPTADLWQKTAELYSQGHIDDPNNLTTQNVWLFFGTLDGLVHFGGGQANSDYFANYMDQSSVFKYDTMECEHGIPTYDFGVNCPRRDNIVMGVYLNKCEYDGPYEALEFIHGNLIRPDHVGNNLPPLSGDWIEFDQSEFVDFPSDPIHEPWDPAGWAYVPSGCRDKTTVCKLHVHFHGCGMGRYWIGDLFVQDSQFPFVAELNDMIIVYPQVRPSDTDGNGCWDWWGHNSNDQSYKTGPQMLASKRIIDRVTGDDPYPL